MNESISENSLLLNDLILSKELGYEIFSLSKESFDNNPYLERDLRNLLKIINKDNNNISLYDLKYYYMFFYNFYIDEKIMLPTTYLNDSNTLDIDTLYFEKNINNEDEKKDIITTNIVSFNSLYNDYCNYIFKNEINLIYNDYIYLIKKNKILFDANIVENKIKHQIIFYFLVKKFLKCNKITFLILTKLL
jgi:hypothetical protein